MAGRRFVLEPLAELAPEIRHPVTRRTIREMLGDVMDQQVRRVEIAKKTFDCVDPVP